MLILLELTSLGFVSKNIKEMRTLLQKLNIDDHYVINKLKEVVIRCSFMIYCKRNKIGQIQNYFLMNEFSSLSRYS